MTNTANQFHSIALLHAVTILRRVVRNRVVMTESDLAWFRKPVGG